MMATMTTTSLFLLLALGRHALAAECYRPNGTNPNLAFREQGQDDVWEPCNNTEGEHSMCCNVFYGDTCLDTGLCWNQGAELLWRDSCTDPTWQDPACKKLCDFAKVLNQYGEVYDGVDSTITVCAQDNSLCCGDGEFGQECCKLGKGYFLLENGTVIAASDRVDEPTSSISRASSSTAGTTSASTTQPTTTAALEPSPQPEMPEEGTESSSGSNGGLIGGVVGGVVGGLALIGLVAWLAIRRRKPKNNDGGTANPAVGSELDTSPNAFEVLAVPATAAQHHNADFGGALPGYPPQQVHQVGGLHEKQGSGWGGMGWDRDVYEMSGDAAR